MPPGQGRTVWGVPDWFPTSPLRTIRAKAPGAAVTFDPGTDNAAAAAVAKTADVAIVFATQWESEGMDLDSLTLPLHQDELIEAVAAATPYDCCARDRQPRDHALAGKVSAILEAWYAGSQGAEALANIIFGVVNPARSCQSHFR